MSNMNVNAAIKEAMDTLSHDTGGKAFFDSNDFAPVFAQVQHDTLAYYAIVYPSTNTVRDAGAFDLDVPLDKLMSGKCLCQLNAIDDAGASFAFPRFARLVHPPELCAGTQQATAQSSSSGGAE